MEEFYLEKNFIKPPVEIRYAEELAVLNLKENDKGRKPENWFLSPKAVRTFILGTQEPIEYQGEQKNF